jgi:beta-glucosidase
VIQRGDFKLITLPTDFLGMNLYTGFYVRAGKRGQPEPLAFPAAYPRTDCAWHYLVPQVLYWAPRLFTELYGPLPIYITEHGAGYDEENASNGEVADLHRIDCVRNALVHLRAAIADGAPVKGYFLWSFIDNFEWEDGYGRRFGIVYNDFKSQRRTPKLSARWYEQVMRTNRLL